MKIGLSFISQIRSLLISSPTPEKMAELSADVRAENAGAGWIAQQMQEMVAQVSASFGREHNDDDTHSSIHATGTIAERGRAVAMGEWIDIPFAATKFTATGGMNWTVTAANVVMLAYTLIGNTIFLAFEIDSTSIAAPLSNGLEIALPAGIYPKRTNTTNIARVIDAGAQGPGVALSVKVPSPLVRVLRADAANYAASVNLTSIQGVSIFEVL
jgi:hypothetical protein